MSDGRVLVGRIVKPHGIRGEVAVEVVSDRPERFAPGAEVEMAPPHGQVTRTLVVVASRPHQGRLLVAFEGVPDRNEAERLRGHELYATDELEQTDTYLVSELVGMSVVTEDGDDLGAVAAVVELPAAAEYDLLEIERDDGSTWLLPAVGDYVEIDEDETGRQWLVLVDPPEGLY